MKNLRATFGIVFFLLVLGIRGEETPAQFFRILGNQPMQLLRISPDGILYWNGQTPGERVTIQRSLDLSNPANWVDLTFARPQMESPMTWVFAGSVPEGFAFAPPGSFIMGSPDGTTGTPSEPGRWPDEVQHEVTLNPFYVQTTAVTWAQWNDVRAWAVVNGYTDLPVGRKGSHGDNRNTEFDPVTMVNWFDAAKWLNARSEKEGLEPVYLVQGAVLRTGTAHPEMNRLRTGYRLPTEAEWEYAARAGTRTAFASGPILNRFSSPIDPSLDLVGWYAGNSGGKTRAVAAKEANSWGIYDKHGNVWEWCWDWHGEYSSQELNNPQGPQTGTDKIHRGGSWQDNAEDARSALRFWTQPGFAFDDLGFRPVRTAPYRLLAVSGDLDFGNVVVGQSSVRELILHNLGGSAVDVQSLEIPDGFSGAWSGAVPPSQSQAVVIQFSPPASGAYEGVARVNSNSMGGELAVFLSGYGVIPSRILAIYGDLNFGAVLSGQSRSVQVVLQNQGSLPLQVNGLSVPRGFSSGWSGTLAPAATQAVQVHFQPTEIRTYSGNFAVSSDASGGTSSIPVSGWGVSELALHLGGNLDFGSVALGETRIRELVIQNIGAAPVEVSGLRTPAGFSGNWTGTLAPSASQTVAIAFQPLALQTYAGAIAVATLTSNSAEYLIQAQGRGVEPVREIQLSGDLAFGELGVGETRLRELVIQNLGNATLQVTSLSLPQGFSGNYSGTIAPAASQVVSISFNPTNVQAYSGDVVAQSNATQGNNRIGITGTGAVPSRILSLSGDMDFGEVPVGTELLREMVIANLGNSDLTVSGISLPEGYSGVWSGTLAPAASQVVAITFAPLAEQSYGGNLTVLSNATSGSGTLFLGGMGYRPMVRVVGGTLNTSNELNGVVVGDFYIGRYEVTWGEWKKVRAEAAARGYDIGNVGEGCADDHPVHTVNWFDILKWCNLKSELEGFAPVYTVSTGVYRSGEYFFDTSETIRLDLSANGYRIPLDAEWEFAARGGKMSKGFAFAGSDDPLAVGWFDENAGGARCNVFEGFGTWPVGRKMANELGLYDMNGNVAELCGGQDINRLVIRGGGWVDSPNTFPLGFQLYTIPNSGFNGNGFRLARRVDEDVRVLNASGNLQFGAVPIGDHEIRNITISNPGNSPLTIDGIICPEGFSSDWSGGAIPVGGSMDVQVTFAPQVEKSYGGVLVFLSDANLERDAVASGVGIPASIEDGGFALIPEGWFSMGDDSAFSEPFSANVYVRDFHIARHEVTRVLWTNVRLWAINNGYNDISAGGGIDATHPVHSVNWWDVVRWCNARSEREGLIPVYRNADGTVFRNGTILPTPDWSANGYRLPTEAEWEKAARGGESGQHFPWGDTITHSQGNYESWSVYSYDISPTQGYHPTYATHFRPYTSPVGSFTANGYGLYDVVGNVAEWCWDWHVDTPHPYTGGASDPKGPTTGLYKVIRGGAWDDAAWLCRIYERGWGRMLAEYGGESQGFRPARSSLAQTGGPHIFLLPRDLDFQLVRLGNVSLRDMLIMNHGNGMLTVSGIDLPEGFTGNWSGVIPAGGTQQIPITFTPQGEHAYSGTITVQSDAVNAENTLLVTGVGVAELGLAGMVLVEEGTLNALNSLNGTVVNTFFLGRYEVTWGMWKAVRSEAAARGYDIETVGEGCADDHPVHSVNWYDVLKWCNLKSEQEGLIPVYSFNGETYKQTQPDHTLITQNLAANGYRLPIEAEWEFAARGGKRTNGFTYSGSNDLNAVGWYWDNSGGAACGLNGDHATWPVGQKAANELGLFDMSGNVWEWCWEQSWYTHVVKRGGSWYDYAYYVSLSTQSTLSPDSRIFDSGFRLARSFEEQKNTISLSGNLDFGEVPVGSTVVRQMQIENQGNVDLTVTGITFPNGFTCPWSGVIAPGVTQEVSVTFAPQAEQSYGGTLTVLSNATSGVSTLVLSGIGYEPMVMVEGGTLNTTNGLNGATVGDFHIGRFEMTWGEWKAVRSWASHNGYDIGAVGQGCADDHPVTHVNWYDVVKWCNAKSQMEGFTPVYSIAGVIYKTGQNTPTQNLSANGYRLPTEAEWEFAARGGNQTNGYTYSGSNDLNAVGWYWDNANGAACNSLGGRGTWPVGRKSANELGLNDMSGNVWEWCWDSIDAKRRHRGGSAFNEAFYSVVSERGGFNPESRVMSLGFRLARSPDTRIVSLSGNLDFADTPPGAESNRILRIENIGNSELTVTGIELPEGFSGGWAGLIPPGQSQEVTITFAPQAEQRYTGNLLVYSDATSGENSRFLQGAGVITRIVSLSGNLDFADTPPGAESNRTLRIENLGNTALSVSGIELPEGFSGGWSGVIPPGETQEVTITFAPQAEQSYSGTLTVQSNATVGVNTLAMTGTGIPATRILWLSGDLDFGAVTVGSDSTRMIEIANQGNSNLTVAGIDLSVGFSANWSGVIAPGVTQEVSVTFAPQAEQSYSGTLTVQSDATVGENTITVTGVGVPEFSLIPAGNFTMGRTSGDTDSDAPPVNVYVSEFYMARHEVTWALWNDVRNWAVNNGYTDIATGGGKGATHPVHTVNWWDVVKWCNARSEREGLAAVYRNADGTVFKTGTTVPTANWAANGYRLPTEAEWEKAARGGVSGQRFPWGDTITHSQANYNSSTSFSYDISPTREYHPTYNDGTMPYTSPVGSFGANGYGLYDMAGNVWEWCWDWYSDSAYTEGSTDPKGPTSGSARVHRGGSWSYRSGSPRSADRGRLAPNFRFNDRGFRPARSSVP